jgi:hypothetical protein
VDFLRECAGFGEHAVVISFRIEFAVSENEHPARAAESTNVRKQIQMIQCDLERLHPSHGESSHGAVTAIGKCTKG